MNYIQKNLISQKMQYEKQIIHYVQAFRVRWQDKIALECKAINTNKTYTEIIYEPRKEENKKLARFLWLVLKPDNRFISKITNDKLMFEDFVFDGFKKIGEDPKNIFNITPVNVYFSGDLAVACVDNCYVELYDTIKPSSCLSDIVLTHINTALETYYTHVESDSIQKTVGSFYQ